ncbi:MAG: orotate phosphoribosyltransferase [Mycoplasma sp.]
MIKNKSEIINILINIGAISINTENKYWWTSGILSPIYIDNRLIFNYPKERNIIENSLANLIKEKFPEVTKIVGVATAGIGHGALVADILELPFAYSRTSQKEHGKKNMIEGKIENDDKIVIVEDLISTGKSVKVVVEEMNMHNYNVIGVVSIFTYNLLKSRNCFKELNIQSYSLVDSDILVESLKANKNFSKSQVEEVYNFLTHLKG